MNKPVTHKIEAVEGTGDGVASVECSCGWKANSQVPSAVASAALKHAEQFHATAEALNWASAVIDFQIDDLEDGLITEEDML